MPLFRCEKCGCVENTATGWYWSRNLERIPEQWRKALCSEHAPKIINGEYSTEEVGEWHQEFERNSATNWFVDQTGFIWRPSDLTGAPHAYGPIIGKYAEDGSIIPLTPEEKEEHERLSSKKSQEDRTLMAKVMAERASPNRNSRPWVTLSNKKSKQKKK